MAPLGGEAGLTDDEAKMKPTEFLVDDLKARITSGRPAGFEMFAILGKPGEDKTKATEQWADEDARPRVKIGTLTITAIQGNETCDIAIFDPQLLADGVEGPKDPLFEARRPAYAISIGQRL
jgi:catalase